NVRRLRRFVTVDRKLLRVDALRAERHLDDLLLEGPEVEVPLAMEEIEERKLEPLPERRTIRERLSQKSGARADGALREAILRGLAEDDVLVPVVRLRRLPDLRPFPSGERDEIGVLRIAGDRVALPDRLLRLLPVLWRDALGVIVDAPEVERGA